MAGEPVNLTPVGRILAWDVAEGASLTAPNVPIGVCALAGEPLAVGTPIAVDEHGVAWAVPHEDP
jgi:hypothetical protein